MALTGKITALGKDKYGFEYFATDMNKPLRLRQVWEIARCGTRGMSYCTEQESIGRDASLTDGRVSCYLGNGNYFVGELAQLGSTLSILVEQLPIPAPKCRTETRWHVGRWEKLLRKGWVAA